MSIVITDNQHYKDIGAAIRQKTSLPYTFLPSQMAEYILRIETGTKVLTESGTFTLSAFTQAGYWQTATVSCGFVPDMFCVYVDGDINSGYQNMMTAVFLLNTNCRCILESSISTLTGNIYFVFERGTNVTVKASSTATSGISASQVFKYVAYKFT